MALCVVAHVDERLGASGGIETRSRSALAPERCLCIESVPAVAAICVPDRIRAALGDSREQGLSRERPVDSGSRDGGYIRRFRT